MATATFVTENIDVEASCSRTDLIDGKAISVNIFSPLAVENSYRSVFFALAINLPNMHYVDAEREGETERARDTERDRESEGERERGRERLLCIIDFECMNNFDKSTQGTGCFSLL